MIFVESPFVAVQAVRVEQDYLLHQPVFCTACFSLAGPLEVALVLAAGYVSRNELLEVVQNTAGEALTLMRWLDFATKTPALPGEVAQASEGIFISIPQDATRSLVDLTEARRCFCSERCLQSWEMETCWSQFSCRQLDA